ncbi:tetratricopeptide repeat protein [Kitasatospora sp. RG8]|nr:tetratricopeptide repeat protein [Kitasatospora sp. RG8]
MFRTACDGRAAVFGFDHPATLASRNRLAWTAGQQGRLREADTELRKILAIRRGLFGEEHHDTLATRERLAWVTALQGRLPEAEEELGAVVSVRTRLLGADYPGTMNSTVLLARVIAQRGRPREAGAILDAVHRRQVRLLGADHPQTGRRTTSLGTWTDLPATCRGRLGLRVPPRLHIPAAWSVFLAIQAWTSGSCSSFRRSLGRVCRMASMSAVTWSRVGPGEGPSRAGSRWTRQSTRLNS